MEEYSRTRGGHLLEVEVASRQLDSAAEKRTPPAALGRAGLHNSGTGDRLQICPGIMPIVTLRVAGQPGANTCQHKQVAQCVVVQITSFSMRKNQCQVDQGRIRKVSHIRNATARQDPPRITPSLPAYAFHRRAACSHDAKCSSSHSSLLHTTRIIVPYTNRKAKPPLYHQTRALLPPGRGYRSDESHTPPTCALLCTGLPSPSRQHASGISHLGQRLVRAAAVVLGTVGEEPVNDHSDNGEKEDNQAPEQLVNGRAVGLQNLDCCTRVSQLFLFVLSLLSLFHRMFTKCGRRGGGKGAGRRGGGAHTEDDDI